MFDINDILQISSAEEFDRAAMDIFRFQAVACAPYREYLESAGIDPAEVESAGEIPFLPIELFKTHRVWCGKGNGESDPESNDDPKGNVAPEAVFTSSSTGGQGASKHYVASLADYKRTYTRGFELFYGDVREWSFYALLPSYLEREGSSLVRMAEGLIRQGRGGGFYLYDHDKLMSDMSADSGPKILLGVSYALLDLAELGEKLPHGTTVMETGGMKGRREEMSKSAMHELLRSAFGVETIHSEYGMAELMSQAYSGGGGVFRTPPWMRVAVRDLSDPFDVRRAGRDGGSTGGDGGSVRGGLNIVDLANLHSCAFIQTQDTGTVAPDGSFTLDGRAAKSDIRGCNLLVQ